MFEISRYIFRIVKNGENNFSCKTLPTNGRESARWCFHFGHQEPTFCISIKTSGKKSRLRNEALNDKRFVLLPGNI